MISALCGAALSMGAFSAQAVTNFEQDVSTSIDLGLQYIDSNNGFNNPSNANHAAGLVLLALLEKRASGDPNDPPQGYAGASAADQERMRKTIAYILDTANEGGQNTYRDGGFLMALARYALTGGPDKGETPDIPNDPDYMSLKEAIDHLSDRLVASQTNGYWGYWGGGADSSTTQFATAGLGSAKAFYTDPDPAHTDPARLIAINTALANARTGYTTNGKQNDGNVCGVLDDQERGHPYRWNSGGDWGVPTLQQTASGTWVQILGGADLNDASVQAYLRWLYNRYRYDNLGRLGAAWDPWGSYPYYLWSSFKVMEFLERSGVTPDPGNLGPHDMGTLDPAAAPACDQREVHRDPDADTRILVGQPNTPGYYAEESPSMYYDYAYQILKGQSANGQYGSLGGHNIWSRQAYALLVLQRATGGACNDTDGDGVCDDVDNCVNTPNPDQADSDTKKAGEPDGQWPDGVGDVCDNCPDTWNPDQQDSDNNGIGDACQAAIQTCDADEDGDIDRTDIRIIKKARGQVANGPDDPRDANHDGMITFRDAKICIKVRRQQP